MLPHPVKILPIRQTLYMHASFQHKSWQKLSVAKKMKPCLISVRLFAVSANSIPCFRSMNYSSVTTVVHLCAPNDRNGNPNRCYVAFAGSALRGAWDERYDGFNAVPPELRQLALNAPRIDVAAGVINKYKRWAKDLVPELCA